MSSTEPFGLSTIGQIGVSVRDLARATAFYRDVLRLPFLFEVPGKMAFFDCAGLRLMLSVPESEEFDHPGSILYFRVDEIDRAHRILAERGAEFERPPHRVADMGTHELWMAFFRDPEHTVLALMSEVPKG